MGVAIMGFAAMGLHSWGLHSWGLHFWVMLHHPFAMCWPALIICPECPLILIFLLPQKLWATLAANRLNIVPSLNFLIDRGLKEDAAGADAGAVAATGKEVRWSWLVCLAQLDGA